MTSYEQMSVAGARRIAVIGAGIGGLTLALALRRHGIRVFTNSTRVVASPLSDKAVPGCRLPTAAQEPR
jgi:glycine/D-amino acid oxidase-like deaminating enzyme